MTKTIFVSAGLLAMLVTFLPAAPARALDFKTFVSSAGNDGNPCTRAAPCLSFQAAHNQTAPGGEINCLDSGPFSDGTTITKSITIDCGRKGGTIFPTSRGKAFVVNGAGIVVRIRNLSISGRFGEGVGIFVLDGAALFVENCVIKDFSGPEVWGIRLFAPTPGHQLMVSDTVIDDHNGDGGNGIIVDVLTQGTAGVIFNRVRLGYNQRAINLVGPMGAFLRDSVVSSTYYIAIQTSVRAPTTNLMIERSSLVNNFGRAIYSSEADSVVRIGESTIMGNAVGVDANSGAIVQSFKNNMIAGNGTDGTPLPAVPTPRRTAAAVM